MSSFRRTTTRLGLIALATAMVPFVGEASAQGYPSQPIKIVVGFAAGGFADSAARVVGDHVSRKLGQTVIVENRGGAASNIAARAVAGAPADGYTILASTTSLAINATLFKKIDYSILKDLTPVAVAVRAPEIFAVNPSRPGTLKEFLAAAKSQRFTYGSAGVGSGSYLTWFSFFKNSAKADVAHVPFKGGAPAAQAAIGGQVDGLATTASANAVAQVTSGKLTCIAVAAAQRYKKLPDCPTLAESGFPGIEASSWVGFWVPAGTPANVVATLNKAINSIAEDKEAAAKLTRNGDLAGLSPEEAAAFVKSEVETWGARVKAAGAEVK
jgi:tripartite-type tricarboxylate transporter receptor subunit TctC